MMRSHVTRLIDRAAMLSLAATAALAIAACGSTTPTNPPAGATNPPPAATTPGGGPTTAPVAGEPCSFVTAEEVGVVLGALPVAVEERAGRGDCDYWLDSAKTLKANIGVFTGPDAATLFEGNKALGESLPVGNLGNEAYMLVLDGLGTIVMAKKGDSVVSVQLLSAHDSAEQAIRVINLAREVVNKL